MKAISVMIVVVFCFLAECEAQTQYIVTDLGSLDGYYLGTANGINNRGQIVGNENNNSNGSSQAFLWQNGIMQGLGTFAGTSSYATQINDQGQIIGGYYSASDVYTHAFVLYNGNLQDFGGRNVSPDDENNCGQVVGGLFDANGKEHAFVYSAGVMKDLGTLTGNFFSEANGINDGGYVVGYSAYSARSGNGSAFLETPGGTMQNLSPYLAQAFGGASVSNATGISNSGYVTGACTAHGIQSPFLLNVSNLNAVMNLGSLGGVYASGNSVNDKGQVVGWSRTQNNSSTHAFVYSNGAMQDLNNLISPSSNWTLGTATAINNAGQIVGNGTSPSGFQHAFLLNPVFNITAYQALPSTCTPIQRFAEWNGTSWVAVNAGDLASRNIHVIVPGWGAGLRTFSDDGGKAWQANDPKTGANTNQQLAGLLTSEAEAIQSLAPGDVVVAFNWLDMSATNTNSFTEAYKSRAQTDEAAADLFMAISQACNITGGGSFCGKLQLVGISHGARVAALATQELYNSGVVVNQLTLADSPEGITALAGASNDLDSILKGIKIGKDSSSTFVDNYPSCFGKSYTENGVVNVQLNPSSNWDTYTKHLYPVDWYTRATLASSNLGLTWSPLEGDLYKTLGSSYTQESIVNGVFTPSQEFVLKDSAGQAFPVVLRNSLQLSAISTQGKVAVIPGGVSLTEGSPAFWYSSFTKNVSDTMLEFNYDFPNPGDGDQLGIWIDDQLRFVITGQDVGSGSFVSEIDISDLSAGQHILCLALHNYGDVNASVEVTNFEMISDPSIVPEPSTLYLLIAAAATALTFLSLRR